jgi:hypothetical protein
VTTRASVASVGRRFIGLPTFAMQNGRLQFILYLFVIDN